MATVSIDKVEVLKNNKKTRAFILKSAKDKPYKKQTKRKIIVK